MNFHSDGLQRNEQFASITPDFHWELGGDSLQCSWIYPTTDSIFGGWIRVAADSILRLTRVPAAEHELWLTRVPAARYELQLIPSCGWLQVAADSILRLSQDLPAGFGLRMTYTLIYPVHLRTYSAKYINFIVCSLLAGFSYGWFRLWLLLQEAWRSLKKLQGSKLQLILVAAADSSCDGWFKSCDQLTTSRILTPAPPDTPSQLLDVIQSGTVLCDAWWLLGIAPLIPSSTRNTSRQLLLKFVWFCRFACMAFGNSTRVGAP